MDTADLLGIGPSYTFCSLASTTAASPEFREQLSFAPHGQDAAADGIRGHKVILVYVVI